jgi:hypothetical protein
VHEVAFGDAGKGTECRRYWMRDGMGESGWARRDGQGGMGRLGIGEDENGENENGENENGENENDENENGENENGESLRYNS